jgi:cytochrome c-type biogenesis protein CcmH/NrfG
VKIGKCWESAGRFLEARRVYERVVEGWPSCWNAMYRLAAVYLHQKRNKMCIDSLIKAYSINQKSNEIKIKLAEALLLDTENKYQVPRNVQKSIELLEGVVSKEPDNLRVRRMLA